MGTVLIKIKLMPTSTDVNLEEIKKNARKVVEKGEGRNINFEEEAIAFGLKAVIVGFALDESKELEPIENKLGEVKNVNSAQITDMRRAF